jgi:1-acyl-sn-glycerol-3-phosphate acyltransferase
MKIFRYIRVCYRMPTALLWTLFVHYFFIRIPQLFGSRKRRLKALRLWGAGFAWIMGVRVHKKNKLPLPMGDLIISNHMGFLDIPVMLASFPSVFVIKVELGRIPFFGKCLHDQGHIFVVREDSASRSSAGKEIMKVLKAKERVIVFPEGRGNPSAERLPFAPGSLAVAERLQKQVQACIIDYLPDRRLLEWDVNRAIFPQLVDLFGRFRIHMSLEYLPAAPVVDAKEDAEKYRALIESRLKEHDRLRELGQTLI